LCFHFHDDDAVDQSLFEYEKDDDDAESDESERRDSPAIADNSVLNDKQYFFDRTLAFVQLESSSCVSSSSLSVSVDPDDDDDDDDEDDDEEEEDDDQLSSSSSLSLHATHADAMPLPQRLMCSRRMSPKRTPRAPHDSALVWTVAMLHHLSSKSSQ
jgi:hypothetical protein